MIGNFFFSNSGAAAYEIEHSLRFEMADQPSLTRTNGTPTDGKKCTVSFWIKKCQIEDGGSPAARFAEAYSGTGNQFHMQFGDGTNPDLFGVSPGENPATEGIRQSDAVFRDPTSWYHLMWRWDSVNGISKIYANGVELASSSYTTAPTTNSVTSLTKSGTSIKWGYVNSQAVDMYLAEMHVVDGQIKDTTDFGKFDSVSGAWVPIAYTGTHGNAGYYLKFDPTAANGIGHDHSGNGNNFTAANFSTTGADTDCFSDSPTNNFCTINGRNYMFAYYEFNEAKGGLLKNIPRQSYSGSWSFAPGTFALTSGKWYYELTNVGGSNTYAGIYRVSDNTRAQYNSETSEYNFSYYSNGGQKQSTSRVSYGDSWNEVGAIVGIAYDLDNGTVEFYKNGVSQGTAFTGLTSGRYVPWSAVEDGSGYSNRLNFGQREFAFGPGTKSATDYFTTVLWTGDNTDDRSITVGFQPDLVWYKRRNTSASYLIFDSVRGATKALRCDNANAENTEANALQAFESNGFQVGSDGNSNSSSYTYVAWCWKAGGTASSNTDGNITSSVSASSAAGFSVFTYTGNGGTDQTVGHGLGVTPSFCIVKSRSSNSWFIRHNSLASNKNLNFNSSGTVDPGGGGLIGDLSSSSTITLKSGSNNADNINANGTTYVAYCWADKDGVTKTGSYVGNGSQGSELTVSCGFMPAMVMIKGDATASWQVIDNKRGDDVALFPDSASGENERSDRQILFTKDGFIVQGNDGNINSSSVNYYWIAFATNFSADESYKSLCSANLPDPDVSNGTDYLNTITYSGNGTQPRSLTGFGFQPSWLWIKRRSGANLHHLVDEVRGVGNAMASDATNADFNSQIGSFDSDGFTTNNNAGQAVNASGSTYVAWSWLATNTSGSSNTDGSITSTVSVNQTAGFSIVTYTAQNAVRTIGHGLGAKPELIIVKDRDSTQNWAVYHGRLGATKGLYLDTAAKQETNSGYWNNTEPTSTVFTVGTNTRTGGSTNNYVAYCFAEVEGFSNFGIYGGNGEPYFHASPMIYTGFTPQFLMIKNYAGGSETSWIMLDSTRDTYNDHHLALRADLPDQEITNNLPRIDFLSNGFKLRSSWTDINENGSTFAYVAFARNPFKLATAR